ncbi:probable beta-D-xylosidase 7 [Impatiens glandulifera]|uniref:probable beta-D-xylosidase 7 n=1 Tax=Impatiens glandulifera TaxID=253017 RepID=UPI001FB15F86|nr:probable beta-D-xylosidase 7 [Impatiens glandulifera]
MKIYLLIIIVFINLLLIHQTHSTQPPFACDESNPSTSSYPFCKSSLPIPKRVEDLLKRLTLQEKISQLVNSATGIPRLGIPFYEWWQEALHGVSRHGKGVRFNGTITTATSFPQVILTAASFDLQLWFRIAQAIGKEARGMYNAGQTLGMTFWAPNINIFRDPRWGRGQETAGEDPLLLGQFSVAYVRGMQGHDLNGRRLPKNSNLMTSACCKHFTAYDLENWKGVDRYHFNAIVSKQDLADTYQPPFQKCVQEAGASGIMCAYNQVNGVPNCADYNLLTRTARRRWGFQGYIVSDCDAVKVLSVDQNYTKTPEDAVADVLKAGMDVNCGSYVMKYAKSAIDQKKLNVSDVDRAIRNLFSIRMRLGLFAGNPTKLPYGDIGPDQVCSKEHLDLALESALHGIVLLKNNANLLPFSTKNNSSLSLAVIGPNSDANETLLGNYEGHACNPITPLSALKQYVNNVNYHSGCSYVNCTSIATDEVTKLAKDSDYVVLFMGLDQTEEREKLDRVNLVLPGMQETLITTVAAAAKKPVVLVLLSGGPVDVSFAKDNPKIGSIIWAGYPGEAGGKAIAKILFGEHNPGGKLPVTWYPQDFVKSVSMTDMRMRPDPSSGFPGRTYRFYHGKTVFEYGYGLSYTTYSYKFASVSKSTFHFNQSTLEGGICDGSKFAASVLVKNEGEMAGKHPVLLFVKRVLPGRNSIVKQLIGFESVRLNGGESGRVEFTVSPCEHLGQANEDGLMGIEGGSYHLVVGDEKHPFTITV